MTTELATIEQAGSAAGTHALASLTEDEFKHRLELLKQGRERIAEIQRRLMRPGVDFGKIPGTGDRPTLLKPGAEKLADFYRLAAGMAAEMTPGDGERAPLIRYEVRCTLHLGTLDGPVVATGWGVCTSHEKKYRYRNEWTNGRKQRVVNDDPWEQANTILKIAEKRAFIDAVLRATASSGLFTQDVGDEDLPDEPVRAEPRPLPQGPDARTRLAQTAAERGVGLDKIEQYAAQVGVEQGIRATDAQIEQIIALIEQPQESTPSGDAASVIGQTPPAAIEQPESVTTSPVDPEPGFSPRSGSGTDTPDGAVSSATEEGQPAPSGDFMQQVLNVTGGTELVEPPKPGSDQYKALSAYEKSQARAYWSKKAEPKGARETHEAAEVPA